MDLDEAATVLARLREVLRRSIRPDFLRVARRRRYPKVILKACVDFLAEERADGEAAQCALARVRARGEQPIPADEVHRPLGLFDSAARGTAEEESDLDFVVEFERKSFDAHMDLKAYLENLLGCRIDLVVAEAIKLRLRDTILGEALHAPGLKGLPGRRPRSHRPAGVRL